MLNLFRRPSVARFAILFLAATSSAAYATAPDDDAWPVSLEEASFEFTGQGHRFEAFRGRDALFIEAGAAWIEGSDFENGTIEFDLAIGEARGFSGVHFRAVSQGNSEHFYIRHHLDGKPDASQYTPVYNGLSGWQIYTGQGFAGPIDLSHNTWMHIKLEVNGDRAAVYVDSNEPSMIIDDLQRDAASGRVGFNAGNARFANIVLRSGNPTIPAAPEAESTDDSTPNTISTWRVSNPFAETAIEASTHVDEIALGITGWSSLDTTHRGIANLARLAPHRPDNTAVAAVTLNADAARTIRAQFGFSDRVRVFLNGQLLYTGSDVWTSRDYRFLGTIGFHDEVALALQEGDNELWFAVSEQFGGWGITAAIEAAPGVTVVE